MIGFNAACACISGISECSDSEKADPQQLDQNLPSPRASAQEIAQIGKMGNMDVS